MSSKMKRPFMVIFMLCVLSFYGCATGGVKVFVNDRDMGRPPMVVCLEKGDSYKIVFREGRNEKIMNINVRTDSYKPLFVGAIFSVDMEDGAVIQMTQTLDEAGSLIFPRDMNLHVPRHENSVAVLLTDAPDSPYDILSEKLVESWFSACSDKNGGEGIPRLSPFLAEGPVREK